MADNFRKSSADERLRAWDPRAHALTTVTEGHRMIHDGFLFYRVHAEADIPDGDFRTTVFRTGSKPVHLKGVTISASEGPINVEFYEDADVTTPGAVLETHNANRLSSRVSEAILYDNTSVVADLGSPFLGGLFIPANGNNGVTGATTLEELVLKPNTDYVFTWENDPAGGGTADVHLVISWYEIGYQS